MSRSNLSPVASSVVLRAVPALVLVLGTALAACKSDGGGNEGGGQQGTTGSGGKSSATTSSGDPSSGSTSGGSMSSGNPSSGSTSSGSTTSGSAGTSSGGSCDMTDPGGQSCSDTSDCNVICDCGASGMQTVGECALGNCGAAADVCGAACGSDYTGSFCFAGKKMMMGCIDNGSHCNFDEDCCSGSCFTGDNTCQDKGMCNPFGGSCSFDEDCCAGTCGDDGTCQ